MHGWTGADNTEMLNTVFARFNEENADGLVIEPTALQWDDLFTQLTLTAAAGNPPDVVMFHNTEVTEYVRKGVLLPVDDLMAAADIDLTGVPQNIIELSKIDGQFYCLPGDLHPMNLYYNRDLVEAAGLDPDSPPTTGEEFMAWAEAMTITDDDGMVTQYGLDQPLGGGSVAGSSIRCSTNSAAAGWVKTAYPRSIAKPPMKRCNTWWTCRIAAFRAWARVSATSALSRMNAPAWSWLDPGW